MSHGEMLKPSTAPVRAYSLSRSATSVYEPVKVESPRLVLAETNWRMDRPFSLASARHWSASWRALAPWKPLPRVSEVSSTTGSMSGSGPSGS